MSEQQITIKKQRLPFTQVPNELLCSNRISGVAKALWCVLYSKPENWTFYWSEILRNFKEGREALTNAKKSLEEEGYIKITQKRIPTGRGNETKFGGMDIELFYDPQLPLTPNNSDSSQTTGFPSSGFLDTGCEGSGIQESRNHPTNKERSKLDLSKQYLKEFISLSPEAKKERLKEIWDKKKFKSSLEDYFLNRESRGLWKGLGNLEADCQVWENIFKKMNPNLYTEQAAHENSLPTQEDQEIADLREILRDKIPAHRNIWTFASVVKKEGKFVIISALEEDVMEIRKKYWKQLEDLKVELQLK